MAKKGLVISLVAVAVVAGLAGYKFAVKPDTTTEKAPVAKTVFQAREVRKYQFYIPQCPRA